MPIAPRIIAFQLLKKMLLAQQRHLSLNELMDELSTQALKEFDVYLRFLARTAQGNNQQGLDLLDKLDSHYTKQEHVKS